MFEFKTGIGVVPLEVYEEKKRRIIQLLENSFDERVIRLALAEIQTIGQNVPGLGQEDRVKDLVLLADRAIESAKRADSKDGVVLFNFHRSAYAGTFLKQNTNLQDGSPVKVKRRKTS